MNDAKAPGYTGSREPVRILVFSASLRKSSLNTRLASLASSVIDAEGGDVDLASMAEFDCPSYDGDAQDHDGFPTGAVELRRRVETCDGFVIASPEYNASLPGVLKNAVDWVSRFHPQPFNERYGLLLSASPSMVGGNRGLWALRVPFEHLGARIYPDMFRWRRLTRRSMTTVGSSATCLTSASGPTSATFSTRSRPPSTIHA